MGYLRFSLAFAVVHGHLVALNAFWQQRIAVFFFFVLSGFLVTAVINRTYGNTLKGKKHYLLNRFLRIYPIYISSLIIAYICISIAPTESAKFFSMQIPKTSTQILEQFSIFGLAGISAPYTSPRLIPPAWSLGIEVCFYLLIGLVTAYSRKLTIVVFCLFLCCTLWGYYTNAGHMQMYRTALGTGVVFYLGSLAYHYREKLQILHHISSWYFIGATNILIYLPDVAGFNNKALQMPYMHFSVVCFAVLLSNIFTRQSSATPNKTNHFFADMSYPLFLLHLPLAVLATNILGINKLYGYEVFFPGISLSLIISAALVIFVDNPTKAVRSRVRRI